MGTSWSTACAGSCRAANYSLPSAQHAFTQGMAALRNAMADITTIAPLSKGFVDTSRVGQSCVTGFVLHDLQYCFIKCRGETLSIPQNRCECALMRLAVGHLAEHQPPCRWSPLPASQPPAQAWAPTCTEKAELLRREHVGLICSVLRDHFYLRSVRGAHLLDFLIAE